MKNKKQNNPNEIENLFQLTFVIIYGKPFKTVQLTLLQIWLLGRDNSGYDSSLTEEEKEALSWIGLNEANIKAWQNLDSEDRTAINQMINDIQNTFSNGCN